ncbi:MAG: hypothetical protein JWP63_4587 [Candidatus Solibacter sp.]|nr:hypothetical protein [Candidatus Solibacter sp.]
MVSKPEPKKASIPPLVVVIGLVLVLGLAGFFYLDRTSKKEPPPPPPLSQEARAYAKNLKLDKVEMKAHESYLKQSVVEITGDIQNVGDRTVKLIEITCIFYDAYGQVALRERVPIVSSKLGLLGPNQTRPFRLPFDNVPEAWNQAMPQLVIARIDFQ